MLQLRALEPRDLDLLYRIENDRELWLYSDTKAPYSHYALKHYIKRTLTEDIATLQQVRLVAETFIGDAMHPVALVDLFHINATHRRAEVGIVVLPEYRQQGFATQALCELCHYARHTLQLHQLCSYTFEDNVAAQKLFIKAKFHVAGRLIDWFYVQNAYKNAVILQKQL